ncbi:MAG TPA: malto-oligosyltrehalose synthase [Kofleriaceae bacterium]|nr:malto-oligosyltrehalose synthase [Kofleriaceae bacterium]
MKPPASTYRLQLSADFRLADALAAVPYLDALGIEAVYLSPITAATPGSRHGYDCCDPTRVNPELGSEEELAALSAALRERGMGLLLDVVPNHMAASTHNPWWREVLARGPAAAAADLFDIEWRATGAGGRPQVLLPVLGGRYGDVLARGEIRIEGEEVAYFDRRLPIADDTRDGLEAARGDVDALHRLLERQHYRLADWRVASERINYRRFFDVSDLVALRSQDPSVFERTHALALRLAQSGVASGLRIDHVDGLWDPRGYLERLQGELGGDAWIVVEKILIGDEELPTEWPVAGTTGYEFGRAVTGLQVDPGGLQALDDLYHRFAGRPERFADLLLRQKRRMLDELFAGEMERRAAELFEVSDRDRAARDLSRRQLADAFAEVTAALPVYRLYGRAGTARAADRALLDQAIADAAARRPDLDGAVLAWLRRVLALDLGEAADQPDLARRWIELVMRWQQLTGPVMAKGLEDTALYQYNRLLSLNMVGGEPDPPRHHLTVREFHRRAARQLDRWWGGLNATTTHDSKRSEDVRSRLHVLAEIPDVWLRAVWRWHALNRPHRTSHGGRSVPDPNEELFVYQTLLGAWPLSAVGPGGMDGFGERIRTYLVKAAREAKVHSSWLEPDQAHEAALVDFASALLDPARAPEFRADMDRLAARVARWGAVNSLAQLALKLAAPGVADFYQGTELWTLTLVDPDNRRPVDLAGRAELLARLERDAPDPAALVRHWHDGRLKMLVTWRGLRARRAEPDLFLRGEYLPLTASGHAAAHLVGFARRHQGAWLVCAVPRLAARLAAGFPLGARTWRDTALALPPEAPGEWMDLTNGAVLRAAGGALRAADLFRSLPVALLRSR